MTPRHGRRLQSILSLFSSACASVEPGAAPVADVTRLEGRGRSTPSVVDWSATRALGLADIVDAANSRRDAAARSAREVLRARCRSSGRDSSACDTSGAICGRDRIREGRTTTRALTPTTRDSRPVYSPQCSSAVRPSASTRSSRRSAAADSARFTSPKTPGSTRRSPSRFRIGRTSTSAICCASRGCSPRSTIRTSSRS